MHRWISSQGIGPRSVRLSSRASSWHCSGSDCQLASNVATTPCSASRSACAAWNAAASRFGRARSLRSADTLKEGTSRRRPASRIRARGKPSASFTRAAACSASASIRTRPLSPEWSDNSASESSRPITCRSRAFTAVVGSLRWVISNRNWPGKPEQRQRSKSWPLRPAGKLSTTSSAASALAAPQVCRQRRRRASGVRPSPGSKPGSAFSSSGMAWIAIISNPSVASSHHTPEP